MDTIAPYRSLRLGEMLNWYRIERILGHGGFGVIYLATDTNLDHLVAIKEYRTLVNPDQTDTRDTATENVSGQRELGLQRFIAEARNLVRFKHPNIVRVMSVFEANNTAYMVMEFEEGEDLREHLKDPLNTTEAALKALIIPVSKGLGEVHKHGFIHRDIKPANILVRKDGTPVLLDFGSARSALPYSEDPLTALVSAGYSPLEQYSDKSDEQQGPWTDIYALGAVLYYSISCLEPVDSAKRGSAILNGAHDPLLPAKMLGRERYSDNFLDAIDWALQFRISDRPQSLSDWMSALLRHVQPEVQRDTQAERPRDSVTRLVESTTESERRAEAGSRTQQPGITSARADSRVESNARVMDPLDGFSMRDQPAPREIEAARVRRTGKRNWRGVFGIAAIGIALVTAATLWGYRDSTGDISDNAAVVFSGKVPGPSVADVTDTGTQETGENALLTAQTEAARVIAVEVAQAKIIAQQREAGRLAEQAEQERIDALSKAAAIATTKQIAAQKEAANVLKQADEVAAAKQRQDASTANEQARLRASRRQFDRQLEQVTLQLDAGQLAAAEQSLNKAAALNSEDARLIELHTRWRSALIDSRSEVSDADFDQVIARFEGLRRALESNDVSTMDALTDTSNQNALFTQLMSRFASLDITIRTIRVRNANKSITATLRIEQMIRSNGDRATPSPAYRERTIVSQRVEGQWSLIRW